MTFFSKANSQRMKWKRTILQGSSVPLMGTPEPYWTTPSRLTWPLQPPPRPRQFSPWTFLPKQFPPMPITPQKISPIGKFGSILGELSHGYCPGGNYSEGKNVQEPTRLNRTNLSPFRSLYNGQSYIHDPTLDWLKNHYTPRHGSGDMLS